MRVKDQLLKDLRELRQALLQRLKNMSSQQQDFRKGESWSPREVLQHLYIAEKLTLRYVMNHYEEAFEKSGIGGLFRAGLLNRFLLSKRKAQAPKATNPRSRELPAFEDQVKLYVDCAKDWESFSEQYPNHRLKLLVFKHPVAGMLDYLQTLGFVKSHIIHHGYQLDRICKDPDFPK